MTTRKRLTMAEKLSVLGAHALCPACSKPYAGRVEYDHILPLAMMGADEVGNLRPLCAPCHAEKTAKIDLPRIAKCKRMAGETGQQARRKRRAKPLMQSHGFNKRLKRGFDGKVTKRDD